MARADAVSRVGPVRGDVGWLDLAESVRTSFSRPLPALVHREARRSLFNVLGVALGASRSPEVGRLADLAGSKRPGPVPTIGRPERVSAYHSALITGAAAHRDDFDDTHLATVIHPGAACLGALWATAGENDVEDRSVVSAFALGCETQLRLGMAVTPGHYDRGWHITGTCGVIGAAVTSALLTDAPVEQLALSIRLAAAQTLGHREAFGTEIKPLHAGKAAAHGLLAAATARRWAAERGSIDGGASMLPLLDMLSAVNHPDRLTTGFGDEWELLSNTYKPYPCGIVAHPGIDAAIDATEGDGLVAGDVESIDYECHPLVPELMGNPEPGTGLQARFSAVHGVAVGLLNGKAGLVEFGDEVVRSAEVQALRSRVVLLPTPDLGRDQATLRITLSDGRKVVSHVPAARGSLRRPLTDDELIAKVDQLITPLGQVGSADLWDRVAKLGSATKWQDIVDATTSAVRSESSGSRT